ncbi:hypothetical protein [Rhizobium sp. MHM7A]|uniref:hypothetical protein n=1 Tax=Rhizobium sp. MHM7A TaxID=2583233 RepID=UPI001105B5D1|nr:hypothetical protein [Rhizobium sp. MHM7A]TLX16921.1 hypothetical protein FFR93_06125 [Rhizobium sp. MHM7A]
MTLSKNLFFSDDEIEAVDMEIETLLLARKRQESQQQRPEAIVPLDQVQPLSDTPVASSLSPEAAPLVFSFPAVHQPSSALPPQRLTEVDVDKDPPTFRINPGVDQALSWPEPEPKVGQRRASPKARRYRFRSKGLIVFAVALLMWAMMIAAGYAVWQSNSLLAVARFVYNLF